MNGRGLTHRQRAYRHILGRHPAEWLREQVYERGRSFEEAGRMLGDVTGTRGVDRATAWRWVRDLDAREIPGPTAVVA